MWRRAERRTRQDWARWIEGMLEKRYPEAERVVLVMDNLNTHGIESLYATYEPRHARQLAERLEIHYTPKHGSWLNIAEIELSTLCGQCLDRRIPSLGQDATRDRGLGRGSESTPNRDQLAVQDGRCTDQAEEPVSTTLSVNEVLGACAAEIDLLRKR